MNDKAEVRAVDTHAKRDGGTDYLRRTLVEGILDTGAGRIGKTGVICRGRKSVVPEFLCEGLRFLPRMAVNNSRHIPPCREIRDDIPVNVGSCPGFIKQVRTIETADVYFRVFQVQTGR